MPYPHFEYSHNIDMELIKIFGPLQQFRFPNPEANWKYIGRIRSRIVYKINTKRIKYIKRVGILTITINNP